MNFDKEILQFIWSQYIYTRMVLLPICLKCIILPAIKFPPPPAPLPPLFHPHVSSLVCSWIFLPQGREIEYWNFNHFLSKIPFSSSLPLYKLSANSNKLAYCTSQFTVSNVQHSLHGLHSSVNMENSNFNYLHNIYTVVRYFDIHADSVQHFIIVYQQHLYSVIRLHNSAGATKQFYVFGWGSAFCSNM